MLLLPRPPVCSCYLCRFEWFIYDSLVCHPYPTYLVTNRLAHLSIRSSFAGDSLLHATVSVEDVGGRQDPWPHNGSGRGAVFTGGEASKEKTTTRVLVG